LANDDVSTVLLPSRGVICVNSATSVPLGIPTSLDPMAHAAPCDGGTDASCAWTTPMLPPTASADATRKVALRRHA